MTTRAVIFAVADCLHCGEEVHQIARGDWWHAGGQGDMCMRCSCGFVTHTWSQAEDHYCAGGTWGVGWQLAAPTKGTERPPGPDPLRRVEDVAHEPGADARRIGLLAMVDIGALIYTDPDRRQDSEGDGVGGVVVGIDERTDAETGERGRVYTTLDVGRGGVRVRRIAEHELSEFGVDAPAPSRLTLLIGLLAQGPAQLATRGRGGRRSTTAMTEEMAERVAWMHRLTGLVMGWGQ